MNKSTFNPSHANTEPYAIDCVSGKYLVLQCTSIDNARGRAIDEYGEVPASVRKL